MKNFNFICYRNEARKLVNIFNMVEPSYCDHDDFTFHDFILEEYTFENAYDEHKSIDKKLLILSNFSVRRLFGF